MKPLGKGLVLAAVAILALALVHVAGAYLLDTFRLADRLFANDVAGVLAALLVLVVVTSRALLAFVVPGCITAGLVVCLLRRIR